MAIPYQTGGDSTRGGSFLEEPGTFHLYVISAIEGGLKSDKSPIHDAIFQIKAGILAGTTPGQEKKTVDITFKSGKPGNDNSGAFQKKKIDRFLLAIGLVTQAQIESKATVAIDVSKMRGRQFVAAFSKEKGENSDRYFVSLRFTDIWHVDDAEVANVPKDRKQLERLPAEHRWIGSRPLGSVPADAAASAPSGVEVMEEEAF